MRAVIQRVKNSSVIVEGKTVGEIGIGLNVLLGIGPTDDTNDIDWLINKLCNLRIFSDNEGLMNKSIAEIQGSFLVISQFTLHASYKKGNRPSFIKAAGPDKAKELFNTFCSKLSAHSSLVVETGVFSADMKVTIENDGPVTIIIDTKNKE